jgi:2-iminobutanoate/2-iminopropanoate deaminase
MNKRAISIQGAPAPIGPYSQAILIENTLYVSGQIPIDPKTGVLQDQTIEIATKQVMDNILALLDAVDMTNENIVKCSIFLKDLGNFNKVNDVYASYFSNIIPPARETVQVSKLPMDVDVEISCIAVRS